jgi:hypothetical protein
MTAFGMWECLLLTPNCTSFVEFIFSCHRTDDVLTVPTSILLRGCRHDWDDRLTSYDF